MPARAALPLWDVTKTQSWATYLGLSSVPLLPEGTTAGEHSLLMDGRTASFALSVCAADHFTPSEALSWAWSSYVGHHVLVDPASRLVSLRRCDSPGSGRKFHLPNAAVEAFELLKIIDGAPPSSGPDVIEHVLGVFRQLRAVLPTPLAAIQALNGILVGTEGVNRGQVDGDRWLGAATLHEALACLSPHDRAVAGLLDDAPEFRVPVGDYLRRLRSPEPITGRVLSPDLLLRHAAGYLYQEAHLVIERSPQESLFGLGFARLETAQTGAPRDARFTPVALARTLVEETLQPIVSEGLSDGCIEILDPACGSGVFLIEALRFVATTDFQGTIRLRGMDRSGLSCVIARFCLGYVVDRLHRTGLRIEWAVDEVDALDADWRSPDVILMNPPFIRWEGLNDEARAAVGRTMGALLHGKADYSGAFLMKAAAAARTAICTVLPASTLDSRWASALRGTLTDKFELALVGRLSSLGYFAGSIVEPAFLLLRRPRSPEGLPVQVVLAAPGEEDSALRSLRAARHGVTLSAGARSEVGLVPPEYFTDADWTPRSSAAVALLVECAEAGNPLVADVFDVQQGVRSGDNAAFVLSATDWSLLPSRERKYFRPTADSVVLGCIHERDYLFFPYSAAGPVFEDEDALRAAVPRYFEQYLSAKRTKLAGRRDRQERWWELSWERAWQRTPRPKLLSTTWGDGGSFAFDAGGRFVVNQGFHWGLIGFDVSDPGGDDMASAVIAVLNSPVFEHLLAAVCPSVQGGQYALDKKYVERARFPTLWDPGAVPTPVRRSLTEIGRQIRGGKMLEIDPGFWAEAVGQAYRLRDPRRLAARPIVS